MDIATFLAAALLLELTPGPNMAYLATLALARGARAGIVAALGVALGLAVHAVVAALGVGALIAESPVVYGVLRWTGVAYLFYLAWEGWRSEAETSPEKADLHATTGPLFVRGFLSNVFNPKSIVFFVSVVPRFVGTGPTSPPIPTQMLIFGTLYVTLATSVHLVIVALAGRLRPWLTAGPRHNVARRGLSIALALVAVWLAWTTHR